jgi:hypothetical protein
MLAFLTPQDLKTLEVEKLNPLSPEVISRQATINIGETAAAAGGQQQEGICAKSGSAQISSVHCASSVLIAMAASIYVSCDLATSVGPDPAVAASAHASAAYANSAMCLNGVGSGVRESMPSSDML